MNQDEYMRWWIENTDSDGGLLTTLPEPVATLAAHVMVLQGRIDRLPAPDEVVDLPRHPWIAQCACAYDDPRAVCMTHERTRRPT